MIRELLEKQRVLVAAGFIFLAFFIVLTVISLFDSTQVLGINRWIKPMKFAISIGIYLLTLAIYLFFIKGREHAKKIIGYGVLLMMTGEIVLIVMQAARVTTSHFNNTTAFDGMVFSAMGLMVLVNTFLVVYLLVLYFRSSVDLPESIVWGMRSGIILLLLSSVVGGVMSVILSHSVGVEDGGAGLPFVNWSSKGGDLRAAHFFGMHAFQAVPLVAYTLERYKVKSLTLWTLVFAAIYLAIFAAVFVQAIMGKPLLGGF